MIQLNGIYRGSHHDKDGNPGEHQRCVRPASNFMVGHDRTPESAENANPIDLTGRSE